MKLESKSTQKKSRDRLYIKDGGVEDEESPTLDHQQVISGAPPTMYVMSSPLARESGSRILY